MITEPPILNSEDLAGILTRLGGQLLRYGCATHRVERCLCMTAADHGYQAHVFVVPTGLWLSVGDQTIRLERVTEGEIDLERLAILDHLFNDVADHKLSVEATHARLDRLEAQPPSYSRFVDALASTAATASTAIWFGGTWIVVWAAALIGLFQSLLMPRLGRSDRWRTLSDLTIGLGAGLTAVLVSLIDPTAPRKPLLLACIILVVPGMTLTAGLSDLVERNLVAGSARLMDAARSMVLLVFGVGLVLVGERFMLGAVSEGSIVEYPITVRLIAMFIGATAFSIAFRVAPLDLPGAITAGILAWSTDVIVNPTLGGPTAAFIGALVVGLFANAVARFRERPAQVFLLSGIVMLVPGTLGFLSMEQLLSGQLTTGGAGSIQTLFSAGGLAIGILVADGILPARKVL